MMKIRFLPFSLIATATATATALLGGANQNSLARFAAVDNKHNKKEAPVDNKHNKKENALVEFARVVKPLLNFKEFKTVSAITFSDLGGCKKDEDGFGWREVPGDDPEVQQAAKHCIKTIQERCNCSDPYVLEEVVHANAEVTGEIVKFNMLLKGKRGEKEDKYKVEEKYMVQVQKNHEGTLHLKYLERHLD